MLEWYPAVFSLGPGRQPLGGARRGGAAAPKADSSASRDGTPLQALLPHFLIGYGWRQGAIMWSVVFIATAFFAITFAVVSYSMREVRRRERRAVWPR